MTCSPARLAANQKNALRSTGPRTERGKQRSRENARKHGMAGEGVVLPPDELAEDDTLTAKLEAEFKPSGEMGRILVRRIATMSNRLDRCGRAEAAAREKRVRDAPKAFEDARHAEVDAIAATLASDPARAVPRLLRTPEGIDWVISAWLQVRGDLSRTRRVRWTEGHVDRVEHLLGRAVGMHPPTPFGPLARAAGGTSRGCPTTRAEGWSGRNARRGPASNWPG
ncbi:hypothetical protein TA3x_001947 [Tundrisphaera sp. TA3]|uniref:hypothetical protein n=1 Tax=Tundrisphaera sp. TA3 TaxID=3435775 RepID=UPI003EB89992